MAVIVINPYQYAAPIGPSADPYSDYVSLLLHGNGANNSTIFIDSSSHNHTVTANGGAEISTTVSKFGGASMYFDGSGDYLTLPNDQTAFDFGTNDFTIESWIYHSGGAGNIFSQRHAYDTNNTGMTWRTESGLLRFFYGNGLSGFATPSGSLSTNTWNHIALTRNGNTFTMWINGQSEATNTITASMLYYPPVIGKVQGVNAEYFTGYLDDLRITKGVARYTSNFTPPTVELPDPSDPNFSSVSLLLHGNGANGSTAFTDSSSYIHTVTPTGDAEISTTESKFGGASMYFDGSGDYLTATDSSFAFGTGEFTVEFWMRAVSTATFEGLLSTGNVNTTDSWQISGGTNLAFGSQSGPSVGDTFPSLNTWHHVAVVRDASSVVTMYINGTNVDSATDTNDYSANNLKIGTNRAVDNFYDGYIDDLRITKGVARYTSNFTPPTAPLPAATIVTDGLVLHLDAANGTSYPGSGNTWSDLSGNTNHATLVNGVGYDSANGGSLTFDGTNDYVSIPNMSTYLTNKVQFSYSTFIKITGAQTFGMFFSFGSGNNWNNDITFYYKPADNTLNFQVNNGADNIASTPYAKGQYDNICVVYDGNQSTNATRLKVYINGNLQTLTFSNTVPASTSNTAFTDCVIGIYSTANYSSNSLFAGNVGAVQLYNKALTQSEITQNFDALKGRYGL